MNGKLSIFLIANSLENHFVFTMKVLFHIIEEMMILIHYKTQYFYIEEKMKFVLGSQL